MSGHPLDRPVWNAFTARQAGLAIAEGPAVLELAPLTEPGLFKTNTYEFGGFIGVKQDGRLIAMAG